MIFFVILELKNIHFTNFTSELLAFRDDPYNEACHIEFYSMSKNILAVTALEMHPLYKITEDTRVKMFSHAEISIFRSIVLVPRKCSVTCYHSGG